MADIILRLVKGSELTHQEMDDNFNEITLVKNKTSEVFIGGHTTALSVEEFSAFTFTVSQALIDEANAVGAKFPILQIRTIATTDVAGSVNPIDSLIIINLEPTSATTGIIGVDKIGTFINDNITTGLVSDTSQVSVNLGGQLFYHITVEAKVLCTTNLQIVEVGSFLAS